MSPVEEEANVVAIVATRSTYLDYNLMSIYVFLNAQTVLSGPCFPTFHVRVKRAREAPVLVHCGVSDG